MDKLYLNVYAVTRHYGGPEEGGWYYNSGRPLASVPIKAERLPGHDSHDSCQRCDQARQGKGSFCRREPTDDQIGYWLYETGLTTESEQYDAWCETLSEETHLVPADLNGKITKVQELEELFADEKHGNIYSVLGGVYIEIQLEEYPGAPWPQHRPHYE